MNVDRALFRTAAVLWFVWGAVHLLAGVMTVATPTPDAIAGIADAVDASALSATAYPEAAGAIIRQHGWNLGWIGVTTLMCAVPVWRGRRWGIVVAAWVGGLADVGYFLFLDLGGFVHFVPGTVMTIVSGSAILASGAGLYLSRDPT